MMQQGKDILFVRLSALGDVAMMVAAVRALQQSPVCRRVSWLIAEPAYQLVSNLPGVEFIVVSKPRSIRDYLQLFRRLRRRNFDILIAAQASLRANLLYPMIRAGTKIGFDRARARDGQWLLTNRRIRFRKEHILDSILAMLASAGIEPRALDQTLPVAQEELAWVSRIIGQESRPVLLVNPGASKSERVWLPERYVETLKVARERWDVCVVLTGTSDAREVALAERIKDELGGDVVNLVGQTTPGQLAALIQNAGCVLAPDTGPVHIAVATGTPVVGLYAVAPSWLSGPYGENELVVDRYDEAVRVLLGREPTDIPWGVRVHDSRAMELITVQEVVGRLALVFERGQARG